MNSIFKIRLLLSLLMLLPALSHAQTQQGASQAPNAKNLQQGAPSSGGDQKGGGMSFSGPPGMGRQGGQGASNGQQNGRMMNVSFGSLAPRNKEGNNNLGGGNGGGGANNRLPGMQDVNMGPGGPQGGMGGQQGPNQGGNMGPQNGPGNGAPGSANPRIGPPPGSTTGGLPPPPNKN